MSQGFVHSIKVPRLYKTAATIVKKVAEDGASLKQLIYEKNHPNLKGIYALATTTLQHGTDLNELIRETKLLINEPRLDPWLARVLITELIWGKQTIKGDAKPLHTILNYETKIRQVLKTIDQHEKPQSTIKSTERKPRCVRINTLIKKLNEAIEDFQDEGYIFIPRSCTYHEYLDVLSTLDGWKFTQDYHIPELLVFAPGTTFYDHLGYKNGAIILQDKASCLPAYLLNPESGSNVLDMCAAPGMKTTHLAAIIDNKGKVFSVERCQRRYEILCNQVSTTHANCVETMNVDAMTLNENKCPDVEYILVDPSCSGSGMQRFTFEGEQSKCAPGRLRSLQSFQVYLLRHALTKFSKVKRVVYSTCSIYPEENEMVVDEVLTNVGDAYKLVPVMTLLNNGWINLSSNEFKCKDNCLYAKPEVDYCNGFFVAVFERNFDVPLPEGRNKNNGFKRNAQHDCDEVDIKKEQSNDGQVDNNGENLTDKVEESDEPVKKKRKKNKKDFHEETIIEEIVDEVSTSKKKHKKNKKAKPDIE